MWNLFSNRSLLSEENEFFQVETFRWLLTHFGGAHFYDGAQLILPTEEFFPSRVSSSEQAALHTFEQVKIYAGLENWPCKLEIQEQDPNIVVGETLVVQNAGPNPHGTFRINDKDEAIITYNPKLISSPVQMVATFAHELAHFLTSTAPEPPPGGWDNWEFATDIAGTFLGFGVFLANSVFNFRQYSSAGIAGWQTSGGGYLSEAEHSYALAIFLLLKDISPTKAYPYCDGNIKALLKRAIKELESKSHIDHLRNVEFVSRAI